MQVTEEVKDVLRRSDINNKRVILPKNLDRKLYVKVNEVLVNAGGKWTKQLGCHIFQSDPREKLNLAVEEGISTNKKKELQAFYTPAELAARVVELANVSGKWCLEPNGGGGALVKEMLAHGAKQVDIVEIDEEAVNELKKKFKNVEQADFLEWKGRAIYDRIVMNPPFAKNQWIKHIEKAWSHLQNDGILVSIIPNSRPTRLEKFLKDKDFSFEKVEAGTFKESGTMVNTAILIINK